MNTILALTAIAFFPGGAFVLLLGLTYEWIDRKLVARFQNRFGPRWFQPLADSIKLLAKEEVLPDGVNAALFVGLPIVALASVLTSTLYVPMVGLQPSHSFPGDLIVTIYLLSLPTMCIGLAGANSLGRFSLVGATRTLTQLFSYEAPFLLALLGPAIVASSWQIGDITHVAAGRWFILTQPVGFVVALIGLMGKLELPPFDAPEAETEVVAGALTEYSGRGLALFHLARAASMVVGLTLVAAFYLGGVANPLAYFVKTLALLLGVAGLQSLFARLRIDQTVSLWWRYGTLLVLAQWLVMIVWKVVMT